MVSQRNHEVTARGLRLGEHGYLWITSIYFSLVDCRVLGLDLQWSRYINPSLVSLLFNGVGQYIQADLYMDTYTIVAASCSKCVDYGWAIYCCRGCSW